MYRIDILTLFDLTVGDVLSESILGRAQERDYLRIETHQIRDYTLNKQKQVDDYPYGGGRGAVMQADPLYQCWKHVVDTFGPGHTIYFSPAGATFKQAVCRLVPGVLPDPECFENESHWNGLLEYPQYSRPEEWHGKKVPAILLSGNHALIARWRRKQAILRTKRRRSDMYAKLDLCSTKEDKKLMKESQEEYPEDFPS